MFVIVAYDIKSKKSAKVLKVCRKYLSHIQKSVFEGNITEKNLRIMKEEIKRSIDNQQDSVCIYRFDSVKFSQKQQIGVSSEIENII